MLQRVGSVKWQVAHSSSVSQKWLFFSPVMLIYIQLSKWNLSRHPPSPSPSAPIPTPPFLLHQPNRLISWKWKPGECFTYSSLKGDLQAWSCNLQWLFQQTAGKVLSTLWDVLSHLQTCSLGRHCHAFLQHCIAGRPLSIHFVVDLGGGTWFHGSHSAAMSALGPVEAIGLTQLVQGIKRSQMLS